MRENSHPYPGLHQVKPGTSPGSINGRDGIDAVCGNDACCGDGDPSQQSKRLHPARQLPQLLPLDPRSGSASLHYHRR
ncbi:MAG: hypothetical protein ACPIB0_04730 [Akkermansiaceae bacterium]